MPSCALQRRLAVDIQQNEQPLNAILPTATEQPSDFMLVCLSIILRLTIVGYQLQAHILEMYHYGKFRGFRNLFGTRARARGNPSLS